MDLTIEFEDGPIEAKLVTDQDEDYEQVLQELSEFVNQYGELQTPPNQVNETNQVNEANQANGAEDAGAQLELGEQPESEPNADGGTITNLSEFEETQLLRILKKGRVEDGQVQENPRVIGDTAELGDTETERLLHASIIIMTVMEDFHGAENMKTSELKQSLEDSGLKANNFSNIDTLDETGVYLNRRGRGSTATTEIRAPGKDAAYEQVKHLLETL